MLFVPICRAQQAKNRESKLEQPKKKSISNNSITSIMGQAPSVDSSVLPTQVIRNNELYEEVLCRLDELIEEDDHIKKMADVSMQLALKEQIANLTSIEVFKTLCSFYADRPAFGSCAPWEPASSYRKITYAQLWFKVQNLATGLRALQLVNTPGEFAAICGFASADWALAEFTYLYLGAVMVPLPLNVTSEDMSYMIGKGEAACLFLSMAELDSDVIIQAIDKSPSLKSIVVGPPQRII